MHCRGLTASRYVTDERGPSCREPEPSKGPIPFHLVGPLIKSFKTDHYVADEGDIVYYETDPSLNLKKAFAKSG